MNKQKKLFFILAAFVLLIATACGGSDSPEPTQEAMPEPTEEVMEDPTPEPEPTDDMGDDDNDVIEELDTVGDIAMASDDFSILVDAVLATGLDTVVQGPGPITVFAPTNAAFEKLPEGTLDSLTEEQLTNILLYHVVEGEVYAEDVMGMDMGTSALGEDFAITVDGDTVMINDATITTADIPASNGVIHVIDTVLLPPSMASGDDMDMASTIYATSNPGELENDSIVTLGADLAEAMTAIDTFADGLTSIESLAFSADGTAYLTADTPDSTGTLIAINDMESMDMMSVADLTAPKGLYIAHEAGLVLVADFGQGAIVAYDLALTPQFTVTDLGEGERSIWDVYHDAATDTLFATGTDGTLLVYADFSSTMGADGPTSTIIPSDADGNQISVNLHGIDYDAATDSLILTDVGSADSPTDGQLFVIPNTMDATGNTTVSLQIGGPQSLLGNPVDVVFDGQSAFVAEKSNDAVLRFDDILAEEMMGMMGDAAPSAMAEVLKAESVFLYDDAMMEDM